MPSRRAGPSDTPQESRKSSLRRLSSLANLQTLNPFSRRRSNNYTDSSNASSVSTSTNPSNSSTVLASPDARTPTRRPSHGPPDIPPLPISAARMGHQQRIRPRSTYSQLPDGPPSQLPRSRTFSNLPLPKSKSSARLPAVTRVPSPPHSTRRHTPTRIGSVVSRFNNQAGARPSKAALVRSDTEPLLSASRTARNTQFNENLALSPVKPSPLPFTSGSEVQYENSSSVSGFAAVIKRGSWLKIEVPIEPLHSASIQRDLAPSYMTTKLGPRSSPIFLPSRDRPPTPGTLQRWNSQPVLSNTTNLRASHGADIKQTRLLSAKHPPTPPGLLATPTNNTAAPVSTSRVKNINNSAIHTRHVSELSPSHRQTTHTPSSPPTNPKLVSIAQPPIYWVGRFAALEDRYRNEALYALHLHPTLTDNTHSHADKMHSAEEVTKRQCRALTELHECCTTQPAQDSFYTFQLEIARVLVNPALGVAIPSRKKVSVMESPEGEGGGGERDSAGRSLASTRKARFMERLLGRNRRSLA